MASSSHAGTPPLAGGAISSRARIAARSAVGTSCLAAAVSRDDRAATRGREREASAQSSNTGTTSGCATVPTLTTSHAMGSDPHSVPAPRRSAASASVRARAGSSIVVPAPDVDRGRSGRSERGERATGMDALPRNARERLDAHEELARVTAPRQGPDLLRLVWR
jgi:hypothetical protein